MGDKFHKPARTGARTTARDEDEILLTPGPVPVPAEVREAAARQVINHRGAAFHRLYESVRSRLLPLFGGGGDPFLFPGSGTGALEAAVVNFFSPGERVAAVVMGEFGHRWASIAETFGLTVERYQVEWGSVPAPAELAAWLDRTGPFAGLLLTYNETSTGAAADLAAVGRLARERRIPLLVDAVSALGGMPLEAERWGVSLVASASQKCLMTPPGLALLWVAPEAWERVEAAALPRAYWDLREARRAGEHRETPYTPALTLWYALEAALERIEAEGLEAVYARHRALATRWREGLRRLGCRLLAGDEAASPTVTAFYPPEGVDAAALLQALRELGVEAAGGQGPLKGRILRVAHMGAVEAEQVDRALGLLQRALERLEQREARG
ncbi:MAG: alanine--glyoxylate aminotransferase family protein [Bacillota bacterium]|nr:alanine--glyoxylate aminotransferase family protein [Bacillota bacterium]